MKNEIDDTAVKDIRNRLRLKKEINATKNRIIKDIRKLLKHEDYYKLARVGNLWSNNYIEYESNSYRNKALSADEYLNNIRPY